MTLPRCYGLTRVDLPTGTESAELDRRAIEESGVPSAVLMENAGRSAALVLERLFPDRPGPVLVLAGSGNNGGDGVVLARTLAARGREVRVAVLGDRPDPEPLLHGWDVPFGPIPDDDPSLELAIGEAAIIVDALLGTGVRGAPRPEHARVIEALDRARAPILSLDVPSGVDADSGRTPGAVVRAAATVAFGSPKLGSLLSPGRELTGRLVAVEIGFPPPGEVGARLITPDWVRSLRPRRAVVTHKKAEGWVLVLAGAPGTAGAAILAARGALRAGAGYVQVASSAENRGILQAAVPEALFIDVSHGEALLDAARSCDVVAAGPGMGTGDEEAARLDGLLPEAGGVVLDADALTLLGGGGLPAFERTSDPARLLLTPHPGEMARLGASRDEIRDNPLEVCREGADRWSSTLLLKGAPSLVADSKGGPVRVSATGSSNLARAGMGDVLTGVAAAFLARGASAADAATLALHYTGRAAALTGRGESLLPTDVADGLGAALSEAAASSDLGLPFVTLDLDPPL